MEIKSTTTNSHFRSSETDEFYTCGIVRDGQERKLTVQSFFDSTASSMFDSYIVLDKQQQQVVRKHNVYVETLGNIVYVYAGKDVKGEELCFYVLEERQQPTWWQKNKRKMILAILSVAFVLCGIWAANGIISHLNKNTDDRIYEITYIPYEDEDNDKYGFINSKGEYIELENMEDSPTSIVNGFYGAEIDGGKVLYKTSGLPQDTIAVLREMEHVGIMNDGLVPVCGVNENISVIDDKGNKKFVLDRIDDTEVTGCFFYSCERMKVLLEDGTFVYVDVNGKPLFDSHFDYATDFRQGYAIVKESDSQVYSLIDETGNSKFIFECDDNDKLCYSPAYGYVATEKDDCIIIHDFEGKQILKCPEKVKSIYAFCKDCFIYENDDEEYGLMSYNGEQLIRAKYDQMVPNGDKFLAIHSEMDEEVRLIDKDENIIETYDGEEIYDFHYLDIKFPNIIVTPDEEILLINENGEQIGQPLHVEINMEGVVDEKYVPSCYFPEEEVLSEVMDVCGDGSGIPNVTGAFIIKDGKHGHTYDVDFLKSENIENLRGKNYVTRNIENHATYGMQMIVYFDEPIVKMGENELSQSAWITQIDLSIINSDLFENAAFFNQCHNKLLEKGCKDKYSNRNEHIMLTNDESHLLVMTHNYKDDNKYFTISIAANNELNFDNFKTAIDNAIAKK